MRLFVAIDFPDTVRTALRELMDKLRHETHGARWVRPEGMHVTLKFLGETGEKKVPGIRAALAQIHSADAVEMHFRGLGFFPNERRPRVLWCGIAASPNLAELAAGVETALEPLGFARESRAFVPHLTLARFPSPGGHQKLVRAAEELKEYDFGSTRESQMYLYQSVLHPGGAEYTRLESFSFLKGAP
jgi:RNA 2',3'-cyclic 3'-phosphodiesterase